MLVSVENGNLLILHWLFACGKIEGKLGRFPRGYPRAAFFGRGRRLFSSLWTKF
jgi:hypothetical protein